MSKRRTREQKKGAKHLFTVSWYPEPKIADSEANVKRQIKEPIYAQTPKSTRKKSAMISAQYDNLASIKADIIKSLSLASLILASEVVLYFIWH